MPPANPLKARLAQRRRRKPGDLRALMKALWEAIRDCERALESATTHTDTISGVHALAAASNAYHKLLSMGEIESRLAILEKAYADGEAARSDPRNGAPPAPA